MKTKQHKRFFYPSLLIVFLIIFSACSKSGSSSTPTNTNSFTWATGGKNYTATIDTAFSGTGYTITPFHIIAGFGAFPLGFIRRVDFHVTSFNTGSYTIMPSPATVNTLQYIDDGGNNLEGTAGTLNITSNSNNLLTGSFSVTLTNASMVTSTITGNFTDVSVRP